MHSTFFVGNTFCLVGIWSDCKFNFWQGIHCKFTEYLYTFVLGCIENVLLMLAFLVLYAFYIFVLVGNALNKAFFIF